MSYNRHYGLTDEDLEKEVSIAARLMFYCGLLGFGLGILFMYLITYLL